MFSNLNIINRNLVYLNFNDKWSEVNKDIGGLPGFIQVHLSKPNLVSTEQNLLALEYSAFVKALVSLNSKAESVDDTENLDDLLEINLKFIMVYDGIKPEDSCEEIVCSADNYWMFEKDASMFYLQVCDGLLRSTGHQYVNLPIHTKPPSQ